MNAIWRCIITLQAMLITAAALAEDWPQFRGPAGNGVANDAKLPTEWGAEQNVVWKVDLPGVAWSQPIVVGKRVFVTTAITDNQRKPTAGGGFGGFGGKGAVGPPGTPEPKAKSPLEEQSGFRRANTAPAGGASGDSAPPSAKVEPKDNDNRPGVRGGFAPGGYAGKGGLPGGGFGPPPGGFNRGGAPPDAIYRWKLLCLDLATGDLLWEQLAKEGKPTIPTQPSNTYASETPVSDGEHVYAYFGMTGLYCFDLDGKLVWSNSLGSFPITGGWGTGNSPVLDGSRLFVQCDNEEKSFVVALDKHSGDELWRVEREEASNWCTPYVWKNKLRTELVTSGSKVRSYDPESGKLLWEYGKIGSGCKATPVGDENLLYVGTGGGGGGMPGFGGKGGFGGFAPRGGPPAPAQGAAGGGRQANSPLVAIKAGAMGDVSLIDKATSNDGVAWSVERAGPPMASPLLYQGCLYVLDQRGGIVGCYDAASGKQHYRERLPEARGFTASPWAADGRVFFLDDSGKTFVVRAGTKLEVLATNTLSGMFWSSSAIADGKLLLRSVDGLYCVAAP